MEVLVYALQQDEVLSSRHTDESHLPSILSSGYPNREWLHMEREVIDEAIGQMGRESR